MKTSTAGGKGKVPSSGTQDLHRHLCFSMAVELSQHNCVQLFLGLNNQIWYPQHIVGRFGATGRRYIDVGKTGLNARVQGFLANWEMLPRCWEDRGPRQHLLLAQVQPEQHMWHYLVRIDLPGSVGA